MNKFASVAVVAFAAALSTAAAMQPASAALSAADRMFVTKAGGAGLAEVADARLALRKGVSGRVRGIAQTMISDHTAANAQLAAIASAQGVLAPQMPDAADRAVMARQRPLSGMAFTMAYLRDQRSAHQQAIALFKHEAALGSNPRLVRFAHATLPTLQHHLMMIQGALGSM